MASFLTHKVSKVLHRETEKKKNISRGEVVLRHAEGTSRGTEARILPCVACHRVVMILDEFELLKKLGEGAFATVWAARRVDDIVGTSRCTSGSNDTTTHRRLYAVKHLKASVDPKTGEDLLTTSEFRSLRAIPRHPNVLRPIQVAREKGQVFLVTEWCDTDLLKLLESAKARGSMGLEEKVVVSAIKSLLSALAHCHQNHWTHRDVKPENVLIADGITKLADFGEAAEMNSEEMERTYVGTRWYRAPEQMVPELRFGASAAVMAHHPGASDVWAAGCVMAECFLGRALFRGSGASDVLRKIGETLGDLDFRGSTPRLREAWVRTSGGTVPSGPDRLEEMFRGNASPEALRVLRRLLRVDPRERATAADALRDAFFVNAEDVKVATSLVAPTTRNAFSRGGFQSKATSSAGTRGGGDVESVVAVPLRSKAAARAEALRRRRDVSDSDSDSDEFDFDDAAAAAAAAAAASARAPTLSNPRAFSENAHPLDGEIPSAPTAEARAAMAEIRARMVGADVSLRTGTSSETEPRQVPSARKAPSGAAEANRVAASVRAARLRDASSSDDELENVPVRPGATRVGARAGRRLLG